jgi:hypothetical protein
MTFMIMFIHREMSGLRADMKKFVKASEDGASMSVALSADDKARNSLLRYVYMCVCVCMCVCVYVCMCV